MSSLAFDLKKRHDAAPKAFLPHLREALKKRHLRPTDFSLQDLAEAFVGRDYVRACGPGKTGDEHLTEAAAGSVQLATFSNITKELLSDAVLEGYNQEEFIASKLVKTVPTKLSGERIPGITRIGDQAEIVDEGQPYPTVGFNEDYIDTPQTVKRGLRCAVTKEAIFFDRTGLVMEQARRVGEELGLNKEKRLWNLIIGATNNYVWKGVSYNTYQASTPWINVKSSNNLVDYTNVDASEQLFANLLDPHTNEPIILSGKTLIVMPPKEMTARHLLNATEIRRGDGASSTVQTIGGNPLGSYTVYCSRLAYRRVQAVDGGNASAADGGKWWFHGDFQKAFAYMENWPITVVQAPSNAHDEFERDIVMQVRASERGAAVVVEPRAVVKNYDS